MTRIEDVRLKCPVCRKEVAVDRLMDFGISFKLYSDGFVELDSVCVTGQMDCPHCRYRLTVGVPLRFDGDPSGIALDLLFDDEREVGE